MQQTLSEFSIANASREITGIGTDHILPVCNQATGLDHFIRADKLGTEIVAWETLRARATTGLVVGQQKMATLSDSLPPIRVTWNGSRWIPSETTAWVFDKTSFLSFSAGMASGYGVMFAGTPKFGSLTIPENTFGPNGLFSGFEFLGRFNMQEEELAVDSFSYRIYLDEAKTTSNSPISLGITTDLAIPAGVANRYGEWLARMLYSETGFTNYTNLTQTTIQSKCMTSFHGDDANHTVVDRYALGTNVDWTVQHTIYPQVRFANPAGNIVLGSRSARMVFLP